MSAPRSGPEPGRARSWLFFGASVVAVLAVGTLAGWIGSRNEARTDEAGAGRTTTAAVCNAADVARRVLPSVVTIEVSSPSGEGSGSGEVIDPSGIVLTNDHVIAEGSGGRITVRLDDGTELPAEIVGRDPRTDLAVLRTEPDRRLPALDWGDSNRLVVGEPVVALGAPLGLSGSVTTGVVSALGRSVPVPTADGTGTTVLTGAIQTDASINPGNRRCTRGL
ncbi:S1C family serine protease [Curtobacterium sp. MCLR17_043]|uniref:S1C family serine protease n=1 Tax=Curtobacterium sp. MCLR17_043 TaxID=2175627 RepID=UPI0015E8AF8D|nr:trypsin-like peptidase domain-containing protein [Curtobacterium sp. MCLR17_043]